MPAASLKERLLAVLPRPLHPWWGRLESSPLGYRLARGAFWSLAGAFISRGLGLVASVFVARMLGKWGFGELTMIQTTVGMFGTFAGFGMGLTATKYVAELRASDPQRSGRIIVLSSLVAWISGLLITAVLAVSAPWLAQHTLAAPHLGRLLRVGSLLLLMGAVSGAQTGALSGFEAFKRIAQVNFYGGLAAFPLMIGGVWWMGLEGAVWALIGSQGFNSFLSFLALRREAAAAGVPLQYGGCAREFPVLWRFSLPAVLSGAMAGSVYWLCNALFVNQPGGYGEMGVFGAANQWRTAILFIPGMLASVALPMLSNLDAVVDVRRYRKVLKVNLLLSLATSGAVALPVALLSWPIMASYGASFASGALVLVILSLTSIFIATLNIVGQAIASQGRMWIGFLLNAIWAGAIIGGCLVMKNMGALGLSLANLAAYSIHLGTVSLYLYRRLKTLR